MWVPIVLVSYFFLAISSLVDKILLSKVFTHPIIYVIWVSFLSLAAFVVLPFVTWIGWYWLFISLVTGAIFTLALYLLYTSLQKGEASRVVPFIGGAVPVIIFMVSFVLKLETFTTTKIIAFAALLAGSVLITIMPAEEKKKIKRSAGMFTATSSSIAFAAFFLLTQYVFSVHNFIDGIFWPRVGTALVLVILMMYPANRHLLLIRFRELGQKARIGIISNQGLAALGFLGQNYAIKLGGSLSLITALQGVQYAFILVFAALLTLKFPKIINEKISRSIIIQKVIALFLIVLGLYYMSF